MRPLLRRISIALVLLLVGLCAEALREIYIVRDLRSRIDQKASTIAAGQSIDDVIAIMGTPTYLDRGHVISVYMWSPAEERGPLLNAYDWVLESHPRFLEAEFLVTTHDFGKVSDAGIRTPGQIVRISSSGLMEMRP